MDVRNSIENLYGFPVVSEPIADVLLQHCPDEIELFEVKVAMPKQSKYYFVNVLTLIDNCIDLEQSVFELILPERPDILIFKYLEKLVLDTQKINQSIFVALFIHISII